MARELHQITGMNAGRGQPIPQSVDEPIEERACFQALIEGISDIVTILDPDGTIRYESPSIESALGYTPEEMLGRNAFELIHPDDVAKIQGIFHDILRQTDYVESGEFRFCHKDGSWRVFEAVGKNLLDDPVVRGVMVTSRDITDRRRTEEALRASEERYRGLFETMLEGFALCEIICGADGKPCDFRYLDVNAAFEKILGVTRSQAIGKTVREIFPQVEDSWIETYGKVALTGEPLRFENYLQPLNKHFEVAAFSPKRGQFAAIFQDITKRRDAEERSRLQNSALSAAANGIVITDRAGSILWTNPAFTKLTGYAAEEVLGKNPRMLKSGTHNPDFYHDLWQTVMSGRVWRGDMVNRRKDGSLYNEEMTITPLRDDRGEITHFIAIKQDVTIRKQTETSLRESEAMFRSLSASSPLGILLTGIHGLCTYVNPRCREILGCSLMECQNDGWTNFIHPDDRAAALQRWHDYVNSGQGEYSHEFRVQRRNGSVCDVQMRSAPLRSDEGVPTGFVSTIEDITERRKAKTALEESERKYRALVEQSADGILVSDNRWCIRFANAAMCNMLGYTPEELQLLRVLDTYLPEDRDAATRRWQALDTTTTVRYERNVRKKDGTFFPAEVILRRIEDGWFQGIIRDITERKRAENDLRESKQSLENALQELKAAQQQVVQQERLRALGTMASGIAHDFNNALAAILGFSELLTHHPEYLADKEKTLRYLQMISTAAQDASNVVNRLREFYRKREESEVFAPVDLNQLVDQAVALTQPMWKNQAEIRGIAIQIVTELGKIPLVIGSAPDLRQALMNLILNAVDALPQGGTITLRTHSDSSRVTLEVADTGMGMTEEVRRRCLEPFFTTKGDRGTGLGLSMVYGILERHAGTIDIQSEVGKGTTFTIHLPHPSGLLPAQADHVEQSAKPARSLRVLVVDDEPMVRNIIGEYLKAEGHAVEIATNGPEGLTRFQNAKFDVVLLDRAMPGMSGDQVAAAIKQLKPEMPVILLTGFGSMMQAAGEEPPGVNLVLGKPVTIAGLRSALAKVVAPR